MHTTQSEQIAPAKDRFQMQLSSWVSQYDHPSSDMQHKWTAAHTIHILIDPCKNEEMTLSESQIGNLNLDRKVKPVILRAGNYLQWTRIRCGHYYSTTVWPQ